MTDPATQQLVFDDLGRIGYDAAFDMQRRLHAEVQAGERPPTVLLLEHDPPVMTVSRRKGADAHLLASPQMLERQGIEVRTTDRGGDITYHGPGQLVAYPILRLDDFGLNLRRYIRLLEQVVIDAVSTFGVEAARDDCAVGVWVDRSRIGAADGVSPGAVSGRMPSDARGADHGDTPSDPQGSSKSQCDRPQSSAKLAAIGVRIRKWTTMHGLALNVTTNLDHFGLIVPCGLRRPVTSLRQLLGERCPSMGAVKAAVSEALRRHLER